MGKNTDKLDQLVIGTLPENALSAISKIELTVEDFLVWQASRPPLMAKIKNGHFDIAINLHLPIKKFSIVLGSVGSLIGIIIKNWRAIQDLLSK